MPCGGAIGGEGLPEIVTINAFVDLHATEGETTSTVRSGQLQVPSDVVRKVSLRGADFAPVDLAVPIAIQTDGDLGIAHRKFECSVDACAVDLQTQEAGAGHVRRHTQRGAEQQQRPPDEADQHHEVLPPALTRRTSRRPWARAKSNAGCPCCGTPAARAALTRTRASSGSRWVVQLTSATARASCGRSSTESRKRACSRRCTGSPRAASAAKAASNRSLLCLSCGSRNRFCAMAMRSSKGSMLSCRLSRA